MISNAKVLELSPVFTTFVHTGAFLTTPGVPGLPFLPAFVITPVPAFGLEPATVKLVSTAPFLKKILAV